MSVDEADLIAGMTPTGRRIAAPAAELIEAQDDRGLKHLVWRAQDLYRSHPALTADLQLGWMEHPEVTGLARLTRHEPDEGAFAYATGTCWTVAEIVRIYAEEETGAGVKAGLELCYLVAEALSEAADVAAELGVFSHGNLNPWTIVVKPDGQPLVLCYGLPQVEMRVWQEDPRQVPREDSFRYAPPERLEGHDEDIASDLFALALVGLELMVGRPVYDGLLDDIRQQATRGEGMRRLYQWREQLPANVREVLGRALKPDPDTRYRRGLDFVYAVHDLLGSIDVEGPSLLEVMAKVRAVTKRGKGPIIGGKTGMLSQEELRELAADLEEIDDKPLPPPKKPRPEPEVDDDDDDDDDDDGTPAPRWQRRKGAEPQPPPDPKAEARDRLKRRLRRSGTAPGSPPAEEATGARERLRRRLRESSSRSGEPRRRLRRGDDPSERPRRRRSPEASPGVSQSIDLGEPVGFDEADEHTDIDLTPMSLPDLPDEDPPSEEIDEPAATEIGRVVAAVPEPTSEAEAEDAETAVSPLATSGGAAALLERLRSSTGERRRRRPRPPAPSTEAKGPPPDAPTFEPDEGEEEGATVAVRRPSDAPPAAPPPPPPDRATPRPQPEAERPLGRRRPPGFRSPDPVPEREPEPEPDPVLPSDLAEEGTGDSSHTTVRLGDEPLGESESTRLVDPASVPSVEAGGLRVVAPDGRDTSLPIQAGECVAAVVRRAVAILGLQQVDLSGRPVHGWRGRVGDHPLPGPTAIDGIERLHLVAEPTTDHRVAVELDGQRVYLTLPSCACIDALLPALGSLFGHAGPLRATFGGEPLPGPVLVGELRRKPIVLEPAG